MTHIFEFEKNYNLEKIDENLKENIDLISNEIMLLKDEIDKKNKRLVKLRSSLLKLLVLNKIKKVNNANGIFSIYSRKSLIKFNLKKEFQNEENNLKKELLDRGVLKEWYLLNTTSDHLKDEEVLSKLKKYLNYWSNEKYLVHKSTEENNDIQNIFINTKEINDVDKKNVSEKKIYDSNESLEVCKNSKILVSSCEDTCCQDYGSICEFCGSDDIGNCCEDSEYQVAEELREQEQLQNELLNDIYLDGLEMLNIDEMDISEYEQNTDYQEE